MNEATASDTLGSEDYRRAMLARELEHRAFQPPEEVETAASIGKWLTGPVATDDYGQEVPHDSSSLMSLISSLVPHPGQNEEQVTENTLGFLLPSAGAGTMRELARGVVPESVMRMTVFHGTPHKFAPTENNPLGEFDASKIGTGEGAQAYGHGAAYLAGAPDTANTYRQTNFDFQGIAPDDLAEDLNLTYADMRRQHNVGNLSFSPTARDAVDKVRADLDAKIKLAAGNNDFDLYNKLSDQRSELSRLGESEALSKSKGYLYKVDLPDEHIAKMLDWDKTLGEQTESVRNPLRKVLPFLNDPSAEMLSGEQIYRKAQAYEAGLVPQSEMMSARAQAAPKASELMRSAGVPGIRYLDQGSRAAGEGTSNFVVFDPSIARILEMMK